MGLIGVLENVCSRALLSSCVRMLAYKPLVEKNGADSIKNVFILVFVSKLGNRRFHLWLVNYGGSPKIVTHEMVDNQPLSCITHYR